MRRGRLFAHDVKGVIPRMSWSAHNLYNLINRSMPFHAGQATFKKTSMSMYQQRWRSKKFLRGYHGDWIREKQFKRWYLPVDLPNLSSRFKSDASAAEASSEELMPISSLIFRDVERRLDTIVFRSCFARSAREARSMVVQGKVQVNGVQTTISGTLLNPGDLISVQPDAIAMLGKELEKAAEVRSAALIAGREEGEVQMKSEGSSEAAVAVDERQEGQEKPAATEEVSSREGEPATKDENTTEATAIESDESVTEAKSSDTENRSETAISTTNDKSVKSTTKQEKSVKVKKELAPGVFPFNLPPYATPFLFVPPYLEVSFSTCSAIYMRHPTITPVKAPVATERYRSKNKSPTIIFKTDTPSPYPAGGEMFSLAWEHYTRTAPRTRSDMRRLQLEAKTGTEGIKTARAKDAWKKVRAVRRGYDKHPGSAPFTVGALGKRGTPETSGPGHLLKSQSGRGKSATSPAIN